MVAEVMQGWFLAKNIVGAVGVVSVGEGVDQRVEFGDPVGR
ncbi:hypothetical protein ACFQBU_15915 [Jhaorihella thermophila]